MRNIRILNRVIIPFLLVASFTLAAVSLLTRLDAQLTQKDLDVSTSQSAVALQDSLDVWNLALQGLRSYWLGSEYVSLQEFETYVSTIAPHLRGLVAIEWIDENDYYRYAYPSSPVNVAIINTPVADYPNRMITLTQTKTTHQLHVAGPLMLIEGVPGVVLYQAIYKGDQYIGSVVGVIRLDEFLAPTDQFISRRGLYDAVISADNMLMPIRGDSLYTNDGRRVTDAQGTLEPTPSFPILQKQYREASATVKTADQDWQLLLFQTASNEGPWYITLYAAVFLLNISSLVFLIILERHDRRNLELEARERDFVSLVSHQLKAPVTELLWILDTMNGPKTTEKQRASFLKDMRVIVKQSAKLTADLLSVSRIERGVLQTEFSDEHVSDVVKEVLLPLREVARSKRVRIIEEISTHHMVHVDRTKLIESVRNIVDNAIKYGPTGGTVTLSSKAESEQTIVLSIQDHGPGIKPEIQKNLFEKATLFAPKGTGDGSGLGLYLTKQFIELMGGTITFTSSSEGTTFEIRLKRVS